MAVENDLAELKGIGQKHAATLKEMIETRHGKVAGLSEKTVQGWIDAREGPRGLARTGRATTA